MHPIKPSHQSMFLLFSVVILAYFAPCNCDTKAATKIPFSAKLAELWNSRSDNSTDFYDFLQKDVLPRQESLKMDTETSLPEVFSHEESGLKKSIFPCELFHDHTNPKSVHRLKPSDVDLIAAMGDSITAAFAAKSRNVLEIFVEFRGVSWSAGGDKTLEEVTTLPNIIKKYNKNVKGYSVKTTPPKISIPWRSHLNVAVSGAIATDLPGQAETLIKRLKKYDDYEDSWKVLTLWIGGNDLCAYCKNDKHTPDKYIGGIRDALDMLHKEVPKMFVNLVQILDVTRLDVINSAYCKPLHYILCYCGTSDGEETKKEVSQVTLEYQRLVSELVNTGRYDTRDDFTVVIQPFFEQTALPKNPDGSADMSFIAPDCFHFSEKGHRAAALALWNNMIEPVGQKRLMWSKGEDFECPSKDLPYFYTNKNSNSTLRMAIEQESHLPSYLAGQESTHKRDQVKMADKKTNIEGKNSTTVAVVLLVSLVAMTIVVVAALVLKRKKAKYEKLNEQHQRRPASYSSI